MVAKYPGGPFSVTLLPLCRMSFEESGFPFGSSTLVPDTWKLKSPGSAVPPKLLWTTFESNKVGLCLLVKVQVTSCWRLVLMLNVTEPGVGAFTGRVWFNVNAPTGGLPMLVQTILVRPHL